MISELTIDLYEKIWDGSGLSAGTRFARIGEKFYQVDWGMREGVYSLLVRAEAIFDDQEHRVLFRSMPVKLWTPDPSTQKTIMKPA
jgi:hypothetical protein